MSLRRLHHDQPESFAFTPANLDWAEGQIAKYPEGRQASAVIPLLWRAQEQEGWVTRPAVETVARMLGMAQIRVLEVATFYFMFQLRPVGSVAHVQVCGTTSCMICGAEDLVGLCRERIAPQPHVLSADGRFSWEEVECLGACANAPMVQIGKDYYEDLDRQSLGAILEALARGEVPRPGSAKGRWASEPLGGRTALMGEPEHRANGSVELALALGDTVARIDGSGPTASDLARGRGAAAASPPEQPEPEAEDAAGAEMGAVAAMALHDRETIGRPESTDLAAEATPTDADQPALLDAPRGGAPDDFKRIKGIGPKLEALLHSLGVYHFDQIASWSAAEIGWIEHNLEGFKGRIGRDDWVAQAAALAAEGGEA